MKRLVLGVTLFLVVGVVQAAESLQWNSVSLSYQSVDLGGDKLTGLGISGTVLVGEYVFVAGSYASVSDEVQSFGINVDVDYNSLSAGLGFRHAISDGADLFGIVSYQDMEVEASAQGVSESASDNGYGLQAGIRSLITESFELMGSLGYVDIGEESETGMNVSARYYFTGQFSIGVGYGQSGDADTTSLSGTLFF